MRRPLRNDLFIIDPLRVRVTAADNGTFLLDRDDWLNPANPQMPQWEATSPMLLRRRPKRFVTNAPEVAAATGLPDPRTVRSSTTARISCARFRRTD